MSISIEGLSPAISIEQKTTSRNPRSTVGTVTEIYDYMRLLFARIGIPYSPATGLPIESQTVSQMVDRIMAMPEGTRLLSAGADRARPQGRIPQGTADLQKRGFQRVKIDGKMYEIDDAPALDKKLKHDIEVVVDRIVVREGLGNRLADSLETALKLADGIAIAENADSGERTIFSAKFACPVSGFTIPEIEPRLFSFNNPYGACPACDGLGTKLFFDPELVVPDERLSLARGRDRALGQFELAILRADARQPRAAFQGQHQHAVEDLPEKVRDAILFGSGDDADRDELRRRPQSLHHDAAVRGRHPEHGAALARDRQRLAARGARPLSEHAPMRDLPRPPPQARGAGGQDRQARYQPGQRLLDPRRRRAGSAGSTQALTAKQRDIAQRILKEINERLGFLQQCRARISDPVARLRHAVGRREPAHPPRLADRLRPDRRALCAGRAVDRPASARQRPAARDAEAAARSRQHGARGRA